ncbi:MAG TPA: class II D-tagatose-bisphosphate aldolase non-catalytic subunit [Desulfobacterales bacterium]
MRFRLLNGTPATGGENTPGLYAVCSAHAHVISAAMATAAAEGRSLLIEASANQVNQDGGYTGMTPAMFAEQVRRLAKQEGYPIDRILIGADHLGPHVWKQEPPGKALEKSAELARQCVAAGFGKIHLDTLTGVVRNPAAAAGHAAQLCRAAETAASALSGKPPELRYVIGAEVPPPGGALDDPDTLAVTDPHEVEQTLELTAAAFRRAGIETAWERVVAVVVQPGVEFGDDRIAVYRPEKARELASFQTALPGRMTFEIHSTDYQPPQALHQMVRDGFCLLKVGPCLTFAFRAAVFALADMESELLAHRRGAHRSNIRQCLEAVMLEEPEHWRHHYHGDPESQALLRAYSYRDRIRYYWNHPEVVKSLRQLLENLNRPVPPGLLCQYFPERCRPDENGPEILSPEALIRDRIRQALAPYAAACR